MDKTKFKKDLDRLNHEALVLQATMAVELNPAEEKRVLETLKVEKLVPFSHKYQAWYSESLALIAQLLPSRVEDFIAYYKSKTVRKEVTYANYTVEDYLQGLTVTRGWEKEDVAGPRAAHPKFMQQLQILKSLSNRFESSLYDLATIVQADLFDNELDASLDLLKQGHDRASGAVAGVVLEGHLKAVCNQHSLKIARKNPTLADYNDALKEAEIIDVATWRKIQYLGDIRNLCDHKKDTEPTKEQVQDLIDGSRKITKTLF